jgi:chromosome segregation ATPase
MNKIIFCFVITCYSTLLWGMSPSISSGSSDLVPVRSISPSQSGNNQEQVQDRFLLIVRTLDGNEKKIDWQKLISRSLVQNPEHELHPYNQQLKDVAERGFNRMLKEDGLDFTELEQLILENKLSFLVGFEDSMSILEKIEAFRLKQEKSIEENKELLAKNVDLQRANKELRSNYREADLEYRKLCDEYDELSEIHEQLQKEKETKHSELQTFITKHQTFMNNHQEVVLHNQRLSDENNQLRELLEQTKQMVQVVGSEAQNLMEVSEHVAVVPEDDQALVRSKQLLDQNSQLHALVESLQRRIAESEAQNHAKASQQFEEKKDFKFVRMYEDFDELSKRKPFVVVAPRQQQKSRLRLFCALFVTGGMLWGLKYFFNK